MGINVFLSLALALITLEPFSNSAIDKQTEDQSQATPGPATSYPQTESLTTDQKISNGIQSEDGPSTAANNPQISLSASDIQRLVEIERRRDARISVVEKGPRRER